MAVIGLMTQLKISFRQISVLMSSETRPSSPQPESSAAISALRALGSRSVAPAAV
jgi:hypothetical protein